MADDNLQLTKDLINEAKFSDADGKVSKLEQVREILLNRSPRLLTTVAPYIFEMMLETSTKVKKFLIHFAREAMYREKATIVHFIELCHFYIGENNENVIKLMAVEYTKFYDKIIMYVANMKQETSKPSAAKPADLWRKVNETAKYFTEMISSNKSEQLRIQCIRTAETILLFGLPNTAIPVDPRKARAAAAANATKPVNTGMSNVIDLPIHNPFVDRMVIERESEEIFAKLELWSVRGGPQNYPFSPSQMAQLGQALGRIAAQRLRYRAKGVKALGTIMSGKTNKCAEMTEENRQTLIKVANEVLEVVQALPSDVDGLVAKIKSSLQCVESLSGGESNVATNSDANITGVKRVADSGLDTKLNLDAEKRIVNDSSSVILTDSSKKVRTADSGASSNDKGDGVSDGASSVPDTSEESVESLLQQGIYPFYCTVASLSSLAEPSNNHLLLTQKLLPAFHF